MRFAAPGLLWLLLLLPLAAAIMFAAARRRRRMLALFAGGSDWLDRFTSQVNPHLRVARHLLILAALSFAIVAAARPQWGVAMEPIEREGVDVVVVVDTSLSMATEDVAPNRLRRAGHSIGALLERIPGDRVGLVSFAGEASLDCPLTLDHAAVRLFLESLDVEAVPVPGTSLSAAIRTASRALTGDADRAADGRGKAIVLFSDGEDHTGGIDDALAVLERDGIRVFAVGTGTDRGAPIPLRDRAGTLTGYKKNRDGQVVTSRLDERVLMRLALESGGSYYASTPSEAEVDEIARQLSAMDASKFGSVIRRRYEERFQIFLAMAFVALLLEACLGERRRPVAATEGG